MSVKVMSKVWGASIGSKSAKLVLLAIADHADDNGKAWPSIAGLAAKCEMSKRTVIRTIQTLVSDGFLTAKKSHGRTTQYTVKLVTPCHQCHHDTSDIGGKSGDILTKSGDTMSPEPSEPSRNIKSAKPKPSYEGLRFASWFSETLTVKRPVSKRDLTKWAIEYDKLQRIDGKSKAEIKEACQFALNDDFWSSNFLSPLKLRKKNRDGVQYIEVFQAAAKKNRNNQPKLTTRL